MIVATNSTRCGKPENAARYAQEMGARFGLDVMVASEPRQAVSECDMVVTAGFIQKVPHATIKSGWLDAGAFASLVDYDSYWAGAAMKEADKAKAYEARTAYWESMATVIDLSMPESLDFFTAQLEEAKEHHAGLKNGTIKRAHSYSLTYAKKRVNDLEDKVKTAIKLWQ